MLNKITHNRFFLHSLRTALLFIAGFLIYDILKLLEIEWNKIKQNNETIHFAKRKSLHFLIMFIADLFLLYLIALLFGVNL